MKYLQNIVTVSKLVGVVIVIVGGILRLFQGHTDSFQTGKIINTILIVNISRCFIDILHEAS